MNCEQKALISILMGVLYHRENLELLERAVRSILAQTYQQIEVLICDDGSIPEACAFLDRIALEDNRIILVRQENLLTLPQKLNECLRRARGKWIARMDDDDFSQPKRLEKQMEYLKVHPEIAFVGCCVSLEQDGAPVGIRRLPEYPTIRDFLFVQPFIHPSLLFRRQVLEAVGGYSELPRCVGCEDYDLLLRLYELGYIGANVQAPLLQYTIQAQGKSNRTMGLRINEMKTRFVRFKSLGLLPKDFFYVIKPIVVGLIPIQVLKWLKIWRRKSAGY